MMIEMLRQFDVNRMDLEDLIELSANARIIQVEYQTLNVEEPEWLAPQVNKLRREIRTRCQDQIEKRLRELKARASTLRTADEKRADIKAEIEKLQAQLKD